MTTKREIARRWMATESFEWTTGMLAHDHRDRFWRLFADGDGGISAIQEGAVIRNPWDNNTEEWTGEWVELIDAVPDLNDAATWNMLMAVIGKIGLLTEQERFMTACCSGGHVYIGGRFRLRRRMTKAEIKKAQGYDAKYPKSS